MFDFRIKESLQLLGQLGLGLVCAMAVDAADPPPRLISPELFTQSVPPLPLPAPAAGELSKTSVATQIEEQPDSSVPQEFDPDDPALEPVELHLRPLKDWNDLSTQSPTDKVDARYVDGQKMDENEKPNDLTMSQNVTSEVKSLDIVEGGGIENPYFAPVSPFCYKPLYFEEACLERHGQTAGRFLQPWFSGIEFYTRIGLLPVRMLREKPNCLYLTIWPEPVDPAWEYGF